MNDSFKRKIEEFKIALLLFQATTWDCSISFWYCVWDIAQFLKRCPGTREEILQALEHLLKKHLFEKNIKEYIEDVLKNLQEVSGYE